MTSFAFILGVVPLVIAVGAGSEMRRTLGTAVFGGMLGVTLFGIFLTPVFYYVIQWFGDMREKFRTAQPRLPRGWMRPLKRQPKTVATTSVLDLAGHAEHSDHIDLAGPVVHAEHHEGSGLLKRPR
jgi:hypothetical protein